MEEKDNINNQIDTSQDNATSNPVVGNPAAEAEKPKVAFELSKVASDPKKGIAIIAAIALAILYVIYGMFTTDEEVKGSEESKPQVTRPKTIARPARISDVDSSPVIASLPDAPELGDPSQPPKIIPKAPPVSNDVSVPTPPQLSEKKEEIPINKQELKAPEIKSAEARPLPSFVAPPPKKAAPVKKSIPAPTTSMPILPSFKMDPAKKAELEKRRKSSIVLISGEPKKSEEQIVQDASFKKRGNLEYTLSKGKLIDAVVESAMNTEFAGQVKAIISRDVYSESGKVILIPKGSKIYGQYSPNVDLIYGRVDIAWNRIDLPTGYTINFAGFAVDQLGRKGAQGNVDLKMREILAISVLKTTINASFASLLDKVVKPESTGEQSQQGQAEAQNLQNAVQGAYSDPQVQGQYQTIITNMCNAARNAITDKASSAFTQVNQVCMDINSSTDTPENKVNALFAQLMQASNSLITSAVQNSTPSKVQEATQAGMEDFSDAVDSIAEKFQPKASVHIDQGKKIKIFVNQDYLFPKAAVRGSRVIR